jgi:predicted AAA+ superfamily ATPase
MANNCEKLIFGGLHEKQRGIWVPTQHSLWEQGKPRKTLISPHALLIVLSGSVHTSQETHSVSATEPNRLMLSGETVAVYCENLTEHTDTARTSKHTHYVSATEPNRLMLFGETVAVYCENYTEYRDTARTS